MRRNHLLRAVPPLVCALSIGLMGCEQSSDPYTHSMSWSCISAQGCTRADVVQKYDRACIDTTEVFFFTTDDPIGSVSMSRIPAESDADECDELLGLNLFGYPLEPLLLCRASYGFVVELAIPDSNPATSSAWRVEMRPL